MQKDVASDVQKAEVGNIIFLYELDLTPIGGTDILYFTEAIDHNYTKISFNGREYTPIEMKAEGWEVTGKGTMPRPKISVSNALLTFAPFTLLYGGLNDATITRRRTLKKYLDGEAEANPNAEFPKDIYKIAQETTETKNMIEFELASFIDLENLKIPKRQIIRDYCTHTYRTWNADTGAFVYTKATCPYVGTYYYNKLGRYRTNPAEDGCGKHLMDCEMRFAGNKAGGEGGAISIQDSAPGAPSEGDDWLNKGTEPNVWYRYKNGVWKTLKPQPLPTRAFPGVSRNRAQR